jgi:PadR family transcriptional regulator, regulatory protein PadR
MTKTSNPDFLNGVPELVVLQLLARRPMYGYELLRAMERSSGDVLAFGEGCIYPILHRLEMEGHLASRRETAQGRSRVVYRLTASGHKRLAGQIATWRSVAAAIHQVVLGDEHGLPATA